MGAATEIEVGLQKQDKVLRREANKQADGEEWRRANAAMETSKRPTALDPRIGGLRRAVEECYADEATPTAGLLQWRLR